MLETGLWVVTLVVTSWAWHRAGYVAGWRDRDSEEEA